MSANRTVTHECSVATAVGSCSLWRGVRTAGSCTSAEEAGTWRHGSGKLPTTMHKKGQHIRSIVEPNSKESSSRYISSQCSVSVQRRGGYLSAFSVAPRGRLASTSSAAKKTPARSAHLEVSQQQQPVPLVLRHSFPPLGHVAHNCGVGEQESCGVWWRPRCRTAQTTAAPVRACERCKHTDAKKCAGRSCGGESNMPGGTVRPAVAHRAWGRCPRAGGAPPPGRG